LLNFVKFFIFFKENTKIIQAETDSNLHLECGISDDYLSDFIEWKKDRISINQNKISNYVLTAAKDLVILNGNSSLNGLYNCVVDNEIISTYSITFKQSKNYKISFILFFLLIFLFVKLLHRLKTKWYREINVSIIFENLNRFLFISFIF
jgi:hypothetical protein